MAPGSVHTLVPAGEGRAIRISADQVAHIIDEAGGQVVDTWAFVQQDTGEFHSAEHTRVSVGKLFPGLGEVFVTNRRRPILRFEDDRSPGTHDMLIAACDPTRYEQLGIEGWHASCQQNLQSAMASIGHPDVRVPQPINVFMNTAQFHSVRPLDDDEDQCRQQRYVSQPPWRPHARRVDPPTIGSAKTQTQDMATGLLPSHGHLDGATVSVDTGHILGTGANH